MEILNAIIEKAADAFKRKMIRNAIEATEKRQKITEALGVIGELRPGVSILEAFSEKTGNPTTFFLGLREESGTTPENKRLRFCLTGMEGGKVVYCTTLANAVTDPRIDIDILEHIIELIPDFLICVLKSTEEGREYMESVEESSGESECPGEGEEECQAEGGAVIAVLIGGKVIILGDDETESESRGWTVKEIHELRGVIGFCDQESLTRFLSQAVEDAGPESKATVSEAWLKESVRGMIILGLLKANICNCQDAEADDADED